MTRKRTHWLTLALAPLLMFAAAACDDDDGNLNDFDSPGEDNDGVVADATVATPDGNHTPKSGTDDNLPEANEVPEIVRDGLESAFGDAEWVNDVGDIERDGDTLSFKLDRDAATETEAFQESCNAVVDVVMRIPGIDTNTVEVKDENDDVVMRAEDGDSECAPVGE